MDADHLDPVAAIEAADGDVHWSRKQFEKELKGEFRRFFVVVEEGSPDVLAYGGYWKAGPEAQIVNLVVRKDARCRGIGKRLAEFILDCARGEECTVCTLEVRQTNAHAKALYQALGFEVKGTRPKIYQDPVADAVLMEKKL
jgi:ribosomal-protein-alanine N-acetyltransferase